MRLLLTLQAHDPQPVIPINYQYPLSAAIYKIIHRADAAYADFLHNTGYSKQGSEKQFKLFTFSDIRAPFAPPTNDRLYLKSREIQLIVCFHVPQAAENFVKGLFIHQQLDIADKVSRAAFTISQVEMIDSGLPAGPHPTVLLQPISPVVTGKKNDRGHYDFRSPLDADFTECLVYNWGEKYLAAYPEATVTAAELYQGPAIKVLFLTSSPQERKPVIKAGTAEATKIRGYMRFQLKVTAPRDMLELVLNAGMGLYNAQGMGGVEVVG
jgi:CRISPR-associated endoribonuclease Cas6